MRKGTRRQPTDHIQWPPDNLRREWWLHRYCEACSQLYATGKDDPNPLCWVCRGIDTTNAVFRDYLAVAAILVLLIAGLMWALVWLVP